MSEFVGVRGSSAGKEVAGKFRRHRKYNWDRILDGQRHELLAGRDFWTEPRVFQTQVAQMARSRGIVVETTTKREEKASKRVPKRIVVVKATTPYR